MLSKLFNLLVDTMKKTPKFFNHPSSLEEFWQFPISVQAINDKLYVDIWSYLFRFFLSKIPFHAEY